jgi:alginate O-acetyltransferase complex protein AlgI
VLFQTPEFLVVFAISIAGLLCLRRASHQHTLFAVLSYIFYAWIDVRFLILLLITSLVDFAAALGMDGVKLSWRERLRLSGYTALMGYVTLGLNWPMLQVSHQGFSFDNFELAGFFTPRWDGLGASLAAVAAFCVLWPVVYGWLVNAYEGERRRKAFMVVSVVCNLVVLGFFKYFNFFVDSFIAAGASVGIELSRPHLDVLLPMGSSFYTFVSMSYTIDAYRRELVPERSFMRFNLFVCYYPHLVAGPIIRPQNFFPTLEQPWKLRARNIASGFHLVLNGLFKKVLIADAIAPFVENVFSAPSAGATSIAVMLGAAFFAIQIYCDFSGYTDIARGISRMIGPELPINFNFPYFSTSIIEFWRRWHISLSTWLRDYLYIPLGGGRGTPTRVYFNLMATMALGGLWHGASANFLVWGIYQGALLCINRVIRGAIERRPRLDAFMQSKIGTAFRWLVTIYFVLLGWLIFRITDPKDPWNFTELWYCMKKFVIFDFDFGLSSLGLGRGAPFHAAACAGLFVLLHTVSRMKGHFNERLDRAPLWVLPLVYIGLALMLYFLWPTHETAFIYFQF